MKEKVEKLMNSLNIEIIRFINEGKDEMECCSFVIKSILDAHAIEVLMEKYIFSIFPSAEGRIGICLLER